LRRGLSVRRTIGLSVTIVSPANTAKPYKMSFGLWTRVGPKNRVLDGGPDLPWEEAIWGERAAYCTG